MNEWQQKQFAELGRCIRGVSYKPADLREAPGPKAVTLLRSNNIRGGRLNFRDVQFVDLHTVRAEQVLQDADIAICMSNGNRALVGKAGQFSPSNDGLEYTVGAFCSIFRPDPKFDPEFVRHQFGSPLYQRQLDRILAGSAINNLKGSDVNTLVAICPKSGAEQSKIAEILSTVDRAIEQTEALIAKQQRIKTGLMQVLLTRGIDEQGNLRSPETHQFKDSPLGRIPVEWDEKPFFDCVSICEGQRDPKRDPYRDWILVAPDHIESSTGRLIKKETAREQGAISGKYEFAPGDIVYSKIRPYLRKAVLADFKGLCSADMYPLKPKPGVKSEFMFATVLGERFSRYAESVSDRSGFPKINRSELSDFTIAVPSVDEQDRMAATVSESASSILATNANLQKLRLLKTALMQDLLTGEKRVTPLLEPAVTA